MITLLSKMLQLARNGHQGSSAKLYTSLALISSRPKVCTEEVDGPWERSFASREA